MDISPGEVCVVGSLNANPEQYYILSLLMMNKLRTNNVTKNPTKYKKVSPFSEETGTTCTVVIVEAYQPLIVLRFGSRLPANPRRQKRC